MNKKLSSIMMMSAALGVGLPAMPRMQPANQDCKKCGKKNVRAAREGDEPLCSGCKAKPKCPDCGERTLAVQDKQSYYCEDNCGFYHQDDYPELPRISGKPERSANALFVDQKMRDDPKYAPYCMRDGCMRMRRVSPTLAQCRCGSRHELPEHKDLA